MASEEQRLVEQFHRSTNSTIGDYPKIRDPELRLALMREELDELEEAIYSGDMVSVAKELADLLYVAYGTAVSFGLDMEPIYAEVHKSNMTKIGGEKRHDGKQLKPEGYRKPLLNPILQSQFNFDEEF